ncbi:uncharacterized protein LOC116286378 [Actinia tenebrosa]|uniref:Uncharacterized protein LOC116286378 n=1 Tax=Actinia tenebrosa TaxID=6105 RepID=A0A6P8H039_ACTTE|nr:uncharacterized protein LOC116286378 [Actinia tenebrosa]
MNFTFGKRTEQVDWRKLAAVDLDRLTREMDVKTLQDNILNVTYCNIEAELGMQAVNFDPNFIKLFNLAQLIIEYLLHSQEYLSSNLETEVKKVQETMQSAEEVRKELEQKAEAQNKLKKEIKKLKKWIAEYQMMMRAGASGIHKCPYCAKAFVSQEYLSAHLARRHNDDGAHMNGYITSVKPVNITVSSKLANGEVDQDKLALVEEMKQIKDRLYATERDLMNERAAREMGSAREKDQSSSDQSKFREMEENYENWKRMEEERHRREMDNLKNTLLQQMQELQMQSQAEKESFNQAISDLENKMTTRPSMIGSIKDEDEPDGPSKGEIADMMKEQLELIKAQTQDDMQQEMKRLNKKWKTKEDKLQTDHENEMNKVRELLNQYEDKLTTEQSEKDELYKKVRELTKKLNEHDKAIEDSKVAAEQYQQAARQQPILATPPVPRREVTFSDQDLLERDRAKTPDFDNNKDDAMMLFVAANTNRSQYRLWRQRAEGSSEWVDKFNFNAYVRPVGPFTTPVYVYAASGSPYWRQCISGNSKPPSNEYRLDYMFYASQSPVLGSVQLHVLDAGTLPVVRSCVFKSKDLPGWKYKGFSFYAMKSNPKGVNVSSSFEGDQESEESESESESEINKVTEVMKASLESTDTKDMTSGMSSSEWGTGTLQRGEFHPFPHNPDITTHYRHTHDEVMACRQEIEQMVEQKLAKQSLQTSIGRLSSERMNAHMAALATERQARAKKMRNFDQLRNSLSKDAEEIAKRNYKSNGAKAGTPQQLIPRQGGVSPTTRSKPPTMKATATAVRASSSLQQSRNSTKSSMTLSSSGSQDMGLSTGTSVTDRTLSESDPEEEDDSEYSQDGSEWDSTGKSLTPVPAPVSRGQPRPLPTNPKVSVRIPTHDIESDPEDIQPAPISTHYPSSSPGNNNVRGLTSSLERSLGNNNTGKKPVGGVALPGKHDFDDSDFSLSSIEEKTKPTQLTRAELNRTGNRNESTPVPAPRSRPNPSPRKDAPSSSAVEAFSVDDISDFDDSELEMHHL